MESQWSEKCSDPRIKPHLQRLADHSLAALLQDAQKQGIDLPVTPPFNSMDESVGNTWKACIAEFLFSLLPDENPASSA